MSKTFNMIQLRIFYTIYLIKNKGPLTSLQLSELHGVSRRHINQIIKYMYQKDLIVYQGIYKLTKKAEPIEFMDQLAQV